VVGAQPGTRRHRHGSRPQHRMARVAFEDERMPATAPAEQRHFVSVWNPSYAADSMDLHLEILLEAVGEYEHGTVGEDRVYVWWAKLRSEGRSHELPHLDLIRRIGAELDDESVPDQEVHLYLTDYRSLYVGLVTGISLDDVRLTDAGRVPKYVHARARPATPLRRGEKAPYKREADCWFKLADIRRLVADDTTAVTTEVARLLNVRDGHRPVSLYGGMRDMPLVVVRPDARRFFDAEEVRFPGRDRSWWAAVDAARGKGVGQVERDLRENVLGHAAWSALDPRARAFLAYAEMTFREHHADPHFDFSPVILNLSKALEVQLQFIIRAALAGADAAARVIGSGRGRPVDLTDLAAVMPTLGQWPHIFDDEPRLTAALRRVPGGEWLTGDLRRVLDSFSHPRNKAAHDEHTALDLAREWRNRMLGVGCAGVIERFADVRVPRRPARLESTG